MGEQKLVLFWTMDWFPYEAAYPLAALRQPRCSLPCRFTPQRERLNDSDVVVFHAFFVDLAALPARRAGQRRALWNLEPPPHTKLVAWFVSNCAPGGGRMSYVRELQRHVHVDVYGACGELTCGTPGAASPDCYNMLERDYFFYLAFENSLCADYATEKLFNVLRYDVVPVVFGGAAYQRLAPPGALALRMVQLASEPTAYLAHLRWRGSRVLVHDPAAWACELDIVDWHGILGRCQRYDGGGRLGALFW
ncbi:4-galactosyl-N-acetylglucosaminide 3-alpha-L-fucosyltransferase FUT6-like [Pollicipes pollicipes]|uniref:4-galactosyl-N-acetylglucosaminide 3-alpha-L-fucosyltransferase FUT6-like n=1 Tax=Pollicipes pollicipes TaxID=41117 RepID=UPI0018858958|nr:4-galactosyl-N-acetylglucosaminide 3-alpha-L-fucosyltransferase FUT6-like [Pollicipes pollicipes]